MRYTVYLSLLPLPCCVLRLSHGTYILSGNSSATTFFTKFFILHMHHCIVEIRIEFLTNCFDRFYSDSFQCAHHLFIDLIHSIYERIIFLFFRYGLKSAFKVVYNRKNFFLQHLWLRSHTSLTFLFQYAFCNYRTQPCVS